MVVFPNAKINIGLHILGKRTDGFHELQSLFYPVAIKDVLEAIPNNKNEIIFSQSGLPIGGDINSNLCVKTYQLIRSKYTSLPGLTVHLHKNIPMGAGLGGGSADGSFMVQLINSLFDLKMSLDEQLSIAAQLGSDCPFFIYNRPCLVRGRGEVIEPLEVDLKAYHIFLINPGIHINTGWAFQSLQHYSQPFSPQLLLTTPLDSWKDILLNDFESAVFTAHPTIAQIKEQLYEKGAVYASLSGSGSTMYGIFPRHLQPSFIFPENYFTIWV